jgi:hypothetical protein
MLAIVSTSIGAADVVPIELGKVPWLRDYDEALALARKTKRPILILFQEVPG